MQKCKHWNKESWKCMNMKQSEKERRDYLSPPNRICDFWEQELSDIEIVDYDHEGYRYQGVAN